MLLEDFIAGETVVDVGGPPRVVRQVVLIIVHGGVRLDVEGEAAAENIARVVEREVIVGEEPQALGDGVTHLQRDVELGDAGADVFGKTVFTKFALDGAFAAVGPLGNAGLGEGDLFGRVIENVVGVLDGIGCVGLPIVDLGVEVAGNNVDLLVAIERCGALGEECVEDVVGAVGVHSEAVFGGDDRTAELHILTHAGGDELVMNALEGVDVFLR
ncbi:hypothetical protein RAHE111665_15715 [Rariglobus hedericola]